MTNTEPTAGAPISRRRVRVASVDDDTVIRHGLPLLLTDVDVVCSYPGIDGLLRDAPQVDLVLLDLVLKGTGGTGLVQGAAATRAVARAGYPVLIYTNERRPAVLVACLTAGARGIIHKAEPLDALETAIVAVAGGAVVITQALIGLAELAERRGELPTLTDRQRQILAARARGEPFQSIAERLYIARKTAEEHMAVVNGKFADFLRDHSPADLERLLGIAPGDVLE